MQGRALDDGRYALLEELGSGGMATVWLAVDTRLGVERAVKVLRPHLNSSTTSARARFDREARVMAQLEHPHIAPVHDVGKDGDDVYIVMSLLPGGSVADHLDRFGAMPPRQACAVIVGVLEALVAAHERGVVHRDIKPQNVLFDERGLARLTDFGIARVIEGDGMTRTGAVMGTWSYMAPEHRDSAKAADPRSDIYAVGAMLACVLTGKEPYDLHNTESHEEQLGRLPSALRTWIERATRYRPDDRFSSARRAQSALVTASEVLPDDPEDAPHPGEAGRGVRPAPTSNTVGTGLTLEVEAEAPSSTVERPPPEPTGPLQAAPLHVAPTVLTRESPSAPRLPRAALGLVALLALGAVAGGVWWTSTRPTVSPAVDPMPTEGVVPEAAPPPVPMPAPAPEPAPAPAPEAVPVPVPAPRPVVEPEPEPESEPEPELQPGGPVGTLTVVAKPVWGTVFVDAAQVGASPWTGEVSVGRHRVKIVVDGEQTIVRPVEVDEEQPTRFCWDFSGAGGPCSSSD